MNIMKNIKKRIFFLGGVGSPTQFGGELTKNKEIINRLREFNFQVTVLDSFRCNHDKFKLIKLIFRFWGSVLANPKAVFIFSTSFGNIYPLMKLLKLYPVKLHMVYWVIGGNLVERIAAKKYDRKYLEMFSLFLVEGEKMKKRFADVGFNNVIHVPNFKTIGTLPEIRKKNDGKIHFLFLSRISPDKGCKYIFQSITELNRKGFTEKFIVDFYGTVEDEYRLEFEEAVNNTVNVSYCGSLQLQDDCNYEILAGYHYMLFPTYWIGEGFPGVVIDAYRAGVPIIASDWNLNTEFIKDGKTGIIISTHSVDSLTEIMENVIVGKYDNVLMSKNCQMEALKYDTRNVINDRLINEIMK